MGLIETDETNKFTFEAFAAHEFYTEVNRALVRQALAHFSHHNREQPLIIVDMACGTGAVTRLIVEELAEQGRLDSAQIFGVDPSAEALRRAQKGMEELGIQANTHFVQGEADDLPTIVQNADAAFFCNAIHLVPDKLSAFQQMAALVKTGGIFACNSAFYKGTYVTGTEQFYHLWTRRALARLRKEHPGTRLARDGKVTAMQWLTPDEYIHLFQQSGFASVDTSQTDVLITIDAWRDLGSYWLFIEGALPGVPLAQGADALGTAVYEAGKELGMSAVPRTWLQLVGTKS